MSTDQYHDFAHHKNIINTYETSGNLWEKLEPILFYWNSLNKNKITCTCKYRPICRDMSGIFSVHCNFLAILPDKPSVPIPILNTSRHVWDSCLGRVCGRWLAAYTADDSVLIRNTPCLGPPRLQFTPALSNTRMHYIENGAFKYVHRYVNFRFQLKY